MTHKRLYSFVVDPKGEFLIQAQMLVWSLTRIAGVAPQNIVAHVVGEPDPYSHRALLALGVPLQTITPYPQHPWCNKLQQFSSLRTRDFDDVVMLDCDVVVLQGPPLDLSAVQAKPVDTGNPPMSLLEEIFRQAQQPLEVTYSTVTREPTAKANANGGVYVVPRDHFDRLANAWLHWAAWCMERKELFADKLMHVDQVSFALAIASAALPFKELRPEFNFPTHLSHDPAADCGPNVLHYHRFVDMFHNMQSISGLEQVNRLIKELNSAWSRYFQQNFNGPSYWNFRLKQYPDRVVAEGRPDLAGNLTVKESCVQFAAMVTRATNILDVGAGDGSLVSGLHSETRITALDFAIESKDACRLNVPEASWVLHDIRYPYYPVERVGLALCLDLLPHTPTERDYSDILDNVCALDSDILLSGYDAEPAAFEAYEYFHEPLTQSLQRRGRNWIPLSSYGGKTVLFSPRHDGTGHRRDIRNETLQSAVPFVDDHVTLLEAIYKSRQWLGFFPDHLPRCIEYPWVLSHLPADTRRIVDAGAGVSVLPLMLADRGLEVITVDSHPVRREIADRDRWNEWGFLDYGCLDERITSINSTYEDVSLPEAVDAIVSVSVVEHLTTAARKAWFKTARNQLKENGSLLLTIDTVPHTTRLWNYAEGLVVENETAHGDVEHLQGELREAGFSIELVELINWLPQSRVGMARLIARARPGARS